MQHHHGHHHAHGMVGGADGLAPLSVEALMRYGVLPHCEEMYCDSLYDSASYAAAGQAQIPFFQNQSGAGTGLTGTGKTDSETNLELAGQLSKGTGFLIERIELEFQPAMPFAEAVASGTLVNAPAVFGAQSAHQIINDMLVFGRAGHLRFTGPNNKIFLVQGPLNRFVSSRNFRIDTALSDTSTVAGSKQSRVGYGRWEGEPFDLHPVPIWIDANMKFGVQLLWPEGVQALPSGVPGRVFCRLKGIRVHLGSEYDSGRQRHAHHGRREMHHHFGHHQHQHLLGR